MEQVLAQFLKEKKQTQEDQRSRRQRQIRDEQLIRSLSVSMYRSQQSGRSIPLVSHSPCSTKEASSPSEGLSVSKVTDIRDLERMGVIKSKIELYRDFIDSFDFPAKMKTMLLRNSNKHKIRKLTNFQYSLGNPKKRMFDRTSINIYGYRGELVSLKNNDRSFGRNFFFKNSQNRIGMVFPSLPKTFFIAQSDSVSAPLQRRTSELGLIIETDCKRSVLILMNYSKKKILIRFKQNFKGDYCSMRKRGIYQEQNFNVPLVNKFNSKEIQVLNYHKCIKHGYERIINKVDLFLRKLVPSREIAVDFDPDEKLGGLMKLKGTGKFIFFNYFREDLLKICLYDYETDERKELGFVKTVSNVLRLKGSNVEYQLNYVDEMEESGLNKIHQLYEDNRDKMYNLDDIKNYIFEKADLKKSAFSSRNHSSKSSERLDSESDDSDILSRRGFKEEFLAVLDISLNEYKTKQNVLIFIRKDFTGLTLDIDATILLDSNFSKLLSPT